MFDMAEYVAWVARHQLLFMLPKEWADAAGEWAPVFRDLNASAGELADATREVQAGPPPKYVGDHLPAVRGALAQVRLRRRAAEAHAARDSYAAGECHLCRNTGWVLVPHPDFVQGGEWVPERFRLRPHPRAGEPVYLTAHVTCVRQCAFGNRTWEALDAAGKKPLALDRYEARVNPAWADHMRERAAAEARALAAVAAAERVLAPNLEAMMRNLGRLPG